MLFILRATARNCDPEDIEEMVVFSNITWLLMWVLHEVSTY